MSRKEKFFLLFCMFSAFFICGEYAATRPISNALFLTYFSSKAYPWVWLATVPLNLSVIYLYNRFLPRLGPLKIFAFTSTAIIVVNLATSFFAGSFPFLVFLQYAWKDIYVLLMLKQLWSMIHSTISENGKHWYGVIYTAGTFGAVLGSCVPTTLATVIGSEAILCFTLPIYLAAMMVFAIALRFSAFGHRQDFQQELTQSPKPSEAFSLIRSSSTLSAVLFLVIFMQFSVGLMEYQFNANLELNILDMNLRAAYSGKLTAITNMCCLVLQAAGGFLLIRTLGLRKSHVLIPSLLAFSALMSILFPYFGVISFSYVFLKTVDFSLFNIAREMLYAPLKLEEKYKAKAVIDVFAYRTSKAVMSLGIIALQAIAGTYLLSFTSMISMLVFVFWLGVVFFFFNKKNILESV
jgi:AAA family ATP:ADP antiporter